MKIIRLEGTKKKKALSQYIKKGKKLLILEFKDSHDSVEKN